MAVNVLKSPFTIIPLYIMGGLLFLLFIHLLYGGAGIIHHDVRIIIIFQKVPHGVVEETSLGYLQFWLLRDMNETFIPLLYVVSHYMVFLH